MHGFKQAESLCERTVKSFCVDEDYLSAAEGCCWLTPSTNLTHLAQELSESGVVCNCKKKKAQWEAVAIPQPCVVQ